MKFGSFWILETVGKNKNGIRVSAPPLASKTTNEQTGGETD
jgi:hypothetical protein